jgi:Mrp family chromosome partitioning ATPase
MDVLKRAPHLVASNRDRSRIFELDRALLRERYIVFADDAGAPVEAYRMLRAQVLRRARARQMRMIGIVSPADGDGKTLTSINLAMAIAAEPNQTVLLLDLDLRRPSLGAVLQVPPGPGLAAALRGEVSFADVMWRPAGYERMVVAPAGERVDASSELLATSATGERLREIKSRFDDRLILVDLPPVLLSDDVVTVAPLLDGVLLVVSEGVTRREDVLRTRELLANTPVIGVVLNRARDSEKRAY